MQYICPIFYTEAGMKNENDLRIIKTRQNITDSFLYTYIY